MRRVRDSEVVLDDEQRAFLHGHPFTGVVYDDAALTNGVTLSEVAYDDGWQSGVARDYFADDSVAGESCYFQGTRHGWDRRWSPDGQLVDETLYEFGIAVMTRSGAPLDASHADLLARLRAEKADWPSVA